VSAKVVVDEALASAGGPLGGAALELMQLA